MKITIIENGPALIESDKNINLTYPNNSKTVSGSKIYLCRCGKSLDKVQCDGSHKQTIN